MKKANTFLLLIIACLCCQCEFKSDDIIVDETGSEEYRVRDYYVDQNGHEGIVAYISKYTPKYGIVISADEAFLPWGPMPDVVYSNGQITTGMAQNPAFGLSMLQSMKLTGIEKYPAMEWCYQKNDASAYPNTSSWRLPTRKELGLIFGTIKGETSATVIGLENLNHALSDIGAQQIDGSHYYWTCIEDYDGLYPEENSERGEQTE